MKNNLIGGILVLLAVLTIINTGVIFRMSAKQQAAVSMYSLDFNKSSVRPGTTNPPPVSGISTDYLCKKLSGSFLLPDEITVSLSFGGPSSFTASGNNASYYCEKIN
jgi:hypothetical protein